MGPYHSQQDFFLHTTTLPHNTPLFYHLTHSQHHALITHHSFPLFLTFNHTEYSILLILPPIKSHTWSFLSISTALTPFHTENSYGVYSAPGLPAIEVVIALIIGLRWILETSISKLIIKLFSLNL